MVEKNVAGTYTEIVYAPTGEKLALMSGQTLQKAFVPLPGGGTAVYTSAGLSYYRHVDWLGSSRLASTPSRTIYSTTAYAPFGEPYAQSGTTDLSFTGQNSDVASGDYDFLYREYANQGRWPSPDPAGLAAVDPSNPQTWNRYAYVMNDPLAYIDPLGLCGGGDGDTGAPCSPFSYIDGNGCTVSVTYHKEKGYDIPEVTTTCSSGCLGGWNFVPVPFGPGRCVPGRILGDFAREPRDRDEPSWAWTFTKEFFGNFSLKGARQQGETVSACFDRTQKALLGETGQEVLHSVSGASLATSVLTASTTQRLVYGSTVQGEVVNGLGAQISGDVIETQLAANSIATKVIQSGVNNGEILRSVGGNAIRGASVLGKVASVAAAAGIGLEGGFAVACR
jgi:RHS repeat-associated protein